MFQGCEPQTQHQSQEFQKQLSDYQKRLEELDREIFALKFTRDRNKSVVVDVHDQSFRRLEFENGYFFVACDEAQPYLDGYKLHLRFGNPFNCKFNNVKTILQWGEGYDIKTIPPSDPRYLSLEDWKKSRHTSTSELTQSLSAGAWTNVELIMAPASPKELSSIELSLSSDSVSLSR